MFFSPNWSIFSGVSATHPPSTNSSNKQRLFIIIRQVMNVFCHWCWSVLPVIFKKTCTALLMMDRYLSPNSNMFAPLCKEIRPLSSISRFLGDGSKERKNFRNYNAMSFPLFCGNPLPFVNNHTRKIFIQSLAISEVKILDVERCFRSRHSVLERVSVKYFDVMGRRRISRVHHLKCAYWWSQFVSFSVFMKNSFHFE